MADDVNLAPLQIVGKTQEILIVASTSTIVFDIIRVELLHGSGVPLSLIGSGISIKDISWFGPPVSGALSDTELSCGENVFSSRL